MGTCPTDVDRTPCWTIFLTLSRTMRLLAFPLIDATCLVIAEMFKGPFTAKAWTMHLEMSSCAIGFWCRYFSAFFSRDAIFKGSPYMPMPILVSRNDAARPSYSGLSRISSSRRSSRRSIWSSFLLSSSALEPELSLLLKALLLLVSSKLDCDRAFKWLTHAGKMKMSANDWRLTGGFLF